ncbi:MAG TPA: FAD binding domain-containing protein [Solirubrobacteraceae bacterium]|jgi:CO/xanthine dehydrogenase FAD-binding subunit|nr:FAD binding domain-containing protein [Solirubrobacteraceae bacterium]
MKPAPFRYAAPDSLAAALDLLAGGNARPLAGGQSLIPMLNLRLVRPGLLVDLNPLEELAGIELREDGALCIGAMTRQAHLLASAVAAAGWPLLCQALSNVGHAATRNRGTVGGSAAHADPAAQLPVALTALDARFHVRSIAGERMLPAADFFRGRGVAGLAPGDLLVAVEVPPTPRGTAAAFVEHAKTHGGFPTAGVAVLHAPARHSAIALLGAGPAPVRATAAEHALSGGASVDEVASLAAAVVGDDHRRAVIGALARRALEGVTT